MRDDFSEEQKVMSKNHYCSLCRRKIPKGDVGLFRKEAREDCVVLFYFHLECRKFYDQNLQLHEEEYIKAKEFREILAKWKEGKKEGRKQ
jgi:hypothetical protein